MKVVADIETSDSAIAFKTMDFAKTEARILRQLGAYQAITGRAATSVIYDEVARSWGITTLPPEQRRWALAFKAVLGVGMNFYADAPSARKRWLEAHYTELASHDTPKGRKAAKVVAHRVAAALGDEMPPTLYEDVVQIVQSPRRG